MKKTLIAVAALSAMAASAMAAQVTLYGKIDQAIQVTHTSPAKGDSTTKWGGVSGVSSGSRWGLKGTEEIADGYKVGFVFESGIDGMDGSANKDRLFNRDCYLSFDTPFGQFVVGRTGMLSDGNTGDIIAGQASPFGTSYKLAASNAANGVFNTIYGGRTDRAIRYVSPKFAGFKVHAEYANMTYSKTTKSTLDTTVTYNKEKYEVSVPVETTANTYGSTASTKKRYGGLGVSYANGPLYVAVTAETVRLPASDSKKDPSFYSLAANYDFGVVKAFGGFQHARHAEAGTNFVGKYNGGILGVSAPISNGTLMAAVSYRKGETDVGDKDYKWLTSAIGYKYNLSKRTYLYTDVAYGYEDIEDAGKTKTTQFNLGICHNF